MTSIEKGKIANVILRAKPEESNVLTRSFLPAGRQALKLRMTKNNMPKKISENVVIEKTIGPIDEEEALLAELKKVLDAQAQASIKSAGPYNVRDGVVTEGEWKGWRAGQCQLSDDPKTPDYVEPGTLSLQYVQFTPQEAENIFLNVADLNKDMLALNTDTNSKKTGIFCYPYQNGVINQKILNATCEELFLSDSEVAGTKCGILKTAIEELASQEPVKDFWAKAGEKALELLWELPVGIMVGAGFAIGGGLVAKRYGWLDKIKDSFKNGKGNGGAGGASAGGASAGGAAGAAAAAGAGAASAEFSRALELIRNSPSIRVKDPPFDSNNAQCWAASLVLGAAAYWVAGVAADLSLGAIDLLVAGAGIGVGAVEAGTFTTAVSAAGYFY